MTFSISGAAGLLEAILTLSKDQVKNITAVICHPHPLYGGTMHNKVVHTIAKAFVELGVKALRFNYRGVGNSEGSYGEGIGETEDTLAVIEWMRRTYPNDQLWLAGFSFGGYVALRAANQVPPTKLLQIAPSVEHFNIRALQPVNCPWWVMQGESDEVVSPQAVYDWIDTLQPRPTLIRFPGVGHFFHGELITLRDTIIQEMGHG